jgi:hypothetical protein
MFHRSDIEEHDHKKKKNHDGAGGDENFNPAEEKGAEHEEERRHEKNGQDKAKCAGDGIAVKDNGKAGNDHAEGEQPEKEDIHNVTGQGLTTGRNANAGVVGAVDMVSFSA